MTLKQIGGAEMRCKYQAVAILLIGCLIGSIPSISDAGDKFYYGTWTYKAIIPEYPVFRDSLYFNLVFADLYSQPSAHVDSLAKYGLRAVGFTWQGDTTTPIHWTLYSYYSVWEAEGYPGSGFNLIYLGGEEINDGDASGGKARYFSSSNADSGLIQRGPNYWQEPTVEGILINYSAEFRLKFVGVFPDSAKICNMILHDTNQDYILAETTLTAVDFPNNQYKIFTIPYTLTFPTGVNYGKMEFQIFWYGIGDLYVDYVKVYNEKGIELMSGARDSAIINYVSQPWVSTIIPSTGEPVVYGWYQRDEPSMIDQYWPYAHVDSVLAEAEPARLGNQATWLWWDSVQVREYVLRSNPKELHMDPYPVGQFGNNYSGPAFQNGVTTLTGWLNMARTQANNFGKDLWLTIQAWTSGDTTSQPSNCQYPLFYNGRWYCLGGREPTPLELRLQSYLAMCYGANAIMNWKYFYDERPGLLSTGLYDQYNDSTTSKWREIRDFIGPRMKVLGPIYAPLEWQGACLDDVVNSFVLRNGQPSYIDSIRSHNPADEPHWVQVGFFENQSGDTSYFMLVNRECLETEGADYDVFVTKTGGPYQIRDMYTDSIVGSVSGTGNYFTIYLGPGEGKLLRLESVEHGPGLFMPPVNYAGFPGVPSDVVATDFDADGDADLAVANYNPKNPWESVVTIFKNRGNGAFDATGTYDAGPCAHSLFAADYDQDGDEDLAVGPGGCGSNIFILNNNGSGDFPYSESFEAHNPRAVISADFDKDGDPDLAATIGSNWDSVAVLLNHYGWFGPAVYYHTGGTYANYLFAADFNADTYPDLAIPNYDDQNLSILINNGNATFQAPINYYLGNKPWAICGADFDKDGDCDLAIANVGGSPPPSPSITIFKNNGNGTFYLASNYAISQTPTDIVTADFDLDGDFDLSFTCGTSDSLFVWLNSGNGTFQPAEAYSLGGSSGPLVASDLNGDGAPDLAVARGYSKNDVAILINLSTNLPPNPFFLFTPTDGDTVENSVSFDWEDAFDPEGDTVWYALFVSTSNIFHPDSTEIHNPLSQSQYTDTLGRGTYYWKVKVYDKWGAPRWSDQIWSFYVKGYMHGNANGDGTINSADIAYLINYLFVGGPAPNPLWTGDANCDGLVNSADVAYLINYLFVGGPHPC
jgi:hypothetical protein